MDGASGREYTYGEILAAIRRVASGLSRLGLKRGDVLAIVSLNSAPYVVMTYGALCCGAAVATLNPLYTQCKGYHLLKY